MSYRVTDPGFGAFVASPFSLEQSSLVREFWPKLSLISLCEIIAAGLHEFLSRLAALQTILPLVTLIAATID